MKRNVVVVCAILVAGLGVGFALRAGREVPRADQAQAAPRGVLGVEEFMRTPDNHQGTVRVQGVVSEVKPEAHLVVLIDRAEWEACGSVSCAPLSLPVRWTGPLPRVEESVEVRGRVQEETGKLVFVAEVLQPASVVRSGAR